MSRLQKMRNMRSHPMLGKLFKKLKEDDIKYLEQLVVEHELDSNDDYCKWINMWGVGTAIGRTKNYTDMWSILLQCK